MKPPGKEDHRRVRTNRYACQNRGRTTAGIPSNHCKIVDKSSSRIGLSLPAKTAVMQCTKAIEWEARRRAFAAAARSQDSCTHP